MYSLEYVEHLVRPENYGKTIIAIIVCLAVVAIFVWSLSKTSPNNFQQNNIVAVVPNNPATTDKKPEEKAIPPVIKTKPIVVPLNIQAVNKRDKTVNNKV